MKGRDDRFKELLRRAHERHGKRIELCNPAVTSYENVYYLWYNTKDNSTHVIKSH